MTATAKRKEKKGDWVAAGGANGEDAHCTRCGEGLRLGRPLRVDVWIAAGKAFVKAHSNCQPGDFKEPTPADPMAWALSRDTGTSSLTIWSVMTGRPSPHEHYDIPYDSADFGRCYRLLKLFPEWETRLHDVVNACPDWAPFVREWARMKELYELELPQGSDPKLYELMKSLEKEVRP